MKKEQVLGIIRHLLTAAGGYLIAIGAVDDAMFAEASGAIITLVGVGWSLVAKARAN